MSQLVGLRDYLKQHYHHSAFTAPLATKSSWELHPLGTPPIVATILENLRYDLRLAVADQPEPVLLPKLQLQFFYPARHREAIRPLLKGDEKVKKMALSAIAKVGERHHIKNKTLFPLMETREVLFCTVLGGEVIRGLIGDFNQFEITMLVKGGLPITILRHAIYDLRDKKGQSYLKEVLFAK